MYRWTETWMDRQIKGGQKHADEYLVRETERQMYRETDGRKDEQ